ncbi:EAL domain-containing protein [Comamonadaceae bacterium G21597-S1]|nr:EAL domain-containing protein [Comamonadaceae bacterium G21597-S1]
MHGPDDAIPVDPQARRAGARAGMRVRVAMLGMLTLIALVLAAQAWQNWRTEQLRSTDGEIIALAGAQRLFSQRLSLLATQNASDAAPHLLARGLVEARSQAQRLEEMLHEQLGRGSDEVGRVMASARAWRMAREQFFDDVEALIRAREADDAAGVQASLMSIHAQAPDYFASAQALSEQARLSARLHNLDASRTMLGATVLVIGLMVLLALAVVEPTARFVARQYGQVQAQADQMRRLALVAEHTANGVVVLNERRRVDWVNPSFVTLTGYTLDEVRGKFLGPLLLLEERPTREALVYRENMSKGRAAAGEIQIVTKSGSRIWTMVDIQPLHDAGGRVVSWVVVASNIDERVRSRQQRRALFEVLPTGVLVFSNETRVIDCNAAAIDMLGLAPEQVGQFDAINDAVYALGVPIRGDQSELPEIQRPVVRSLRYGVQIRNELVGYRRADGSIFWTLVNVEPLLDDNGLIQGAVACIVDVSAQKRLEQTLRDTARTDSLTSLPNRAVVTDQIAAALARHREQPGYHFAVLFMDFDRFKQVNDTLGHGVGDELLRQIAERLQTGLRESDTFVRTSDFGQMAARIGGDEFVVLLDDIRGDLDAEVVAGRLLDLLAMPYTVAGHTVSSSVSIGIVTATHAAADVEAILRDADIAMYEAKRTGRGRYVLFEPAMHRRVRDDVALENDLRRALSEGELFVVYQPLVDLVSRRMTGLEALVRWRHPQRGLVSPVEFIPIAEAVGLIGKLGAEVLQTACRDFAWLQATLGPLAPETVSVNLSRAQLCEPSLASDILQALRAHGLGANQLQLEITESLAAQDLAMQARLHEVKELGVTLALDDFGTGYSSLSCLHELPIDVVKIDRSFVSLAQTSDYHRVLIEATVLMARTLGMGTLAEGIETTEQAALMRTLGCGKGQGYLFSRPIERDELVQWIRDAHADP